MDYEASLQEFLMAALYARVGQLGTMRGEGSTAQFDLQRSLGGGECKAMATLNLNLPKGGRLEHTADILVETARGRRLAIELQWAASEPDSIKASAYDMLLLKQSRGQKLWGMMIYIRPAVGGVPADRVREICFPYDQFFAIEHQDPQNPAAWVPILDRIEAEIAARQSS